MPFYDYECTNCKYKFETQHSILSEPLKECPKCLQLTLIRCIEVPHVYVVPGDNECSLGTLADRNGKRLSNDAKQILKEKHKTKKKKVLEKTLGPGMNISEEVGHG